jgi:hypothetical protein
MRLLDSFYRSKNTLLNIIRRDLVLLNLGLGIGYLLLWGISIYQKTYRQADFVGFYTAGAIIRDGFGPSLYNFGLQAQYQSNILPGIQFINGPLVYVNPPYAALPFAILSLLPLKTAYILWSFVQIGLLVWLLKLIKTMMVSYETIELRLILSSVIAFPFLFVDLVQGAFSLFLLVCLTQIYLAIKQDRKIRTGVWMAGGLIKPQNMLLLGVFLFGSRRWKGILSAGLVGFGLFVLSGWFFGWEIWPSYLKTLNLYSSAYNQFGVSPGAMYNLRGTLTLLMKGGNSTLINQICWIGLVCASLAIFLLWWSQQDEVKASIELRLSITILLGLFFSPHFNPHDGLLLIFPALLFYIYLRERGLPRILFSIFCLSSPYIILISDYTIGDRLFIRIPVVMMAIFAAWLGKAAYAEYQNNNKLIRSNEAA